MDIVIVAEWITAILQNLICDMTKSCGNGLFFKFRRNKLIKSLRKDIELFCNRNDCMYLNSSAFEFYVKHSKVLENVIVRATSGKPKQSKKEFVREQLTIARNIARGESEPFSHNEERLIKDLLKIVDDRITVYYCDFLSQEQRTVMSAYLEGMNEVKDAVNEAKNGTDLQLSALKNTIKSINWIGDLSAATIAELIFEKVCKGEIDEIEKLLPLIQGKSPDLEVFCKVVISIYSKENSLIDISELKRIGNDSIRSIAVRSVIPVLKFIEYDMSLLADMHVNSALTEIINLLNEKNYDKLFERRIDIDNGIEMHTFVLNKKLLLEEEWLIKQLFIQHLYSMNVRKVTGLMKQIDKEHPSWLSKLFISDKEIDVISYEEDFPVEEKKVQKIIDAMLVEESAARGMITKIQVLYYSALIKCYICCNKMSEAELMMPKEIESYQPLSDFKILFRIKRNEISLQETSDYCVRTKEYWLLNNYFLQSNKEEELIEYAKEHETIFAEDMGLFLMFVGALRRNGKIQDARMYLEKYHDSFKMAYEYWNEFFCVEQSDHIIEAFVKECEGGNMGYLNSRSEKLLIEKLLQLQQSNIADVYVRRLECKDSASFEAKKFRAIIEISKGNHVNAIALLKEAFKMNEADAYVVDTLIVMSLMNNRSVDKQYVDAALKIGTSRMHLLVSEVKRFEGDNNGARIETLKALLLSDSDLNQACAQYFSQEVSSGNNVERKITGVEPDSAVYAKSCSEKRICFCVHAEKVLPKSPHIWNSDIHLYAEDAGQIELLRKHVGDSFIYKDEKYLIEEIAPLDFYFFRTCVSKMEKVGTVQTIKVPVDNPMNTVEFFTDWMKKHTPDEKEVHNWLEQYNNISDVALSLFIYKRFTRASYTQFVDSILESKQIFIREAEFVSEASNKYVLSFAAMMVLYKIGFPVEELSDGNVFITASEKIQIDGDCANLIKEYDRDNVASMGMYDGQFFIDETDESGKLHWLKEAGAIKAYFEQLDTVDNTKELNGDFFESVKAKELLGICDYDALSVAQNNDGYSIITVESFVASMANVENAIIKSVSLIDWMISADLGAVELLDYIEKMVQIGCICAITKNVILYISRTINESGSNAHLIYRKWDKLIKSIDLFHNRIREIAIQHLSELYVSCYKEIDFVDNTIFQLLVRDILILKRQKIEIYIGEDGNLSSRLLDMAEEDALAMIKSEE